ncbi:hypothetical protein ACP4OV_012004 [Aristida adscensionis]
MVFATISYLMLTLEMMNLYVSCPITDQMIHKVADKWLLKENLPFTYHQQVVEFIVQNSGQNNFVPDPSFRDPYTG